MCKVYSVSNQKGGVSKTATCVNLGIGLARAGKKVCLIEAYAQSSLTESLGIECNTIAHSTEISQFDFIVGNHGSAHLRHGERQLLYKLLVGVVSLCSETDCQCCYDSQE